MASSKSSFAVFNEVDESVAKPVLGSDGAARWQDFKQGSKLPTTSSVAPAIPLKKLDRVLGTKSMRDEQANEAKIRREAGDREAGSGYTVFKRKSDHEEIAAEKKRKLVLERVRPDEIPYYLPAETFEGYKFDYVFTTRDGRGTGYYWDGTDSLNKELGHAPTHSTIGDDVGAAAETTKKSTRKKKKKKIHENVTVPETDQFNPMEQIALAISRRNHLTTSAPTSRSDGITTAKADAAALGADSSALNMSPSSAETEKLVPGLIAAGWESAKDSNSGKTYYFRRSTNERTWNKPNSPQKSSDKNKNQSLSEGWKSATDPSSGKVYYYNTSGKTSWKNPLS